MEKRSLPIACGDHSFPLLKHEKVVELVAMLEIEGFDLALMGNRSHIRPEDIRKDIPGAAEFLGGRIKKANLELADVFLIPWTDFETLAPNHPGKEAREDARELFRDVLELAARLQSPGVTLVPGIIWPEDPGDDSLKRAADELQWRSGLAASLGLRCSVEPHIGSVVSTPEEVTRLLDLAPDLYLTLDYTHFVAQGISEERIHPLCRRARHFHARGATVGRGQMPMRLNTIDYGRIVRELKAASYDGYLAVEYVWIEWERMDECDNVSETILMRDRLRSHDQGEEWRYEGATT